MAKHISQQTFDGVVRENMEEFEMSAEEALADALEQFEAQNVDLSNIVKDATLYSNSGEDSAHTKHPLLCAIETLTTAVESDPPNIAELVSSCAKIQAECDEDFARRSLAASNNAFPVLISAAEVVQKQDNCSLLESPINALCALCNGQPDLLDDKGTDLLVDWLKSCKSNPALVTSIVKLIRLTCIKHERNRQAFVARDIIPLYVDTLETYKSNVEAVQEICSAMRVLTFDDDLRVPFGKAHEHAKLIVTEADALKKILAICKEFCNDRAVLGELFSTLSRLAVRNEFCQEIMDLGGLELMLKALAENSDHQGISRQVLGVMKAVAGNDDVKVAICKAGGIELILGAMNKHQRSAVVCETGCAALATLALRQPAHGQQVIDSSGPEIIVKAMQLHPTEEGLQKQGCMAVRNVVARAPQHCAPFLEAGVEPLIQAAMTTHKDCHDEAKAALRDLGCKVDLKELWTGEGKGIHG